MRQGDFSGLVNRQMAPSADSRQRRSCPSLEGGKDGGCGARSLTQREYSHDEVMIDFYVRNSCPHEHSVSAAVVFPSCA